MTTETNAFTPISADELHAATGGGAGKFLKPAAKFVGKKVLGPVSAAWTAYDGVNGYLDARDKGHSVGRSLLEGAKNAVF